MGSDIRLRQICLVASKLAPVVDDIAAILGLEICYRDPNVGHYGLENALLPVDSILLEMVAPIAENTAAGRFLAKTGGRGGYMAILSCGDPDERRRNAERLGVRVAHEIKRPPYHGVQLHPRDCRAAFIEFNHTDGSDDVYGPYPPAGPDWPQSIRTGITRRLLAVEMQSPDPAGLARHWSNILGVEMQTGPGGMPEIALVNASFRFNTGPAEMLSGLVFDVVDAAAVRRAAQARGYRLDGDSFLIGGVDFRLQA